MNIDIRIELRAVDLLIPRATNPRTHSKEQVAQIAASIREWGWTNPILIGADNDLIAGYGRFLAARELGMKEVPVIVLARLSETQKRALVIADNQLALNSGWNEEMLAKELFELKSMDFDLAKTGFELAEIDKLLGPAAGLTEPDEVPPVPSEPVTRPGDLWLLGDPCICPHCGGEN